MKIIVFFFFIFIYSVTLSQITLNKTDHQFDDFVQTSERFTDFELKNTSTKTVYVLRIEHPHEVVYKKEKGQLLPTEKMILRFQVNPKNKGKFDYVLHVYLSDREEPIAVHLKGNCLETISYTNNLTDCPDFTQKPILSPKKLNVLTIDKETGEALSQSTVSVIINGRRKGMWVTGRSGKFETQLASGYFYIHANHDGYLTNEAGFYVSPEISTITIALTKDATKKPAPTLQTTQEEAVEVPEIDQEDIVKQQIPPKIDSFVAIQYPEFAQLNPSNFETNLFKDVNVTFVLDISSSMKIGDRMELLKYALNSFTENLRPTDRIGIVTYSDNAQVFMRSTNGSDKEKIRKSVDDLKPIGMTAGGKGIKLGYKEQMKTFDPNKANIVIIITDGAFNRDSDSYQKIVKKYAKKGVVFSVVGIQTKPRDVTKLTEASNFGKGRFIAIDQLADAQNKLFQEIRLVSYRK